MTRPRTIALTIAVASLAGTIVGGMQMAKRVAHHNETKGRQLYAFMTLEEREYTFADRPLVLTDEIDEHGNEQLLVSYGDEQLQLRPTRTPDPPGMPGLTRHMNWMRLLRFAPLKGLDGPTLDRAISEGVVDDRLAIAIHIPFQGVDPESLGEVWKRDSWFEFYEFMPDGSITRERKSYPESAKALGYRQARARREGKPIPERSPDDLNPDSWQYQAASILRMGRDRATMLPGAVSPDLAFTEDAISAMGWTLPFTSVSILVLATSIAFAVAPRRVREESDSHPST